MLGIPTLLARRRSSGCPTSASVVLSFTSWDGIGGLGTIEWVGTRNYQQIFDDLPAVLAGGPAQPDLAGLLRARADAVRAAARRPARQADPRHAASTRASSSCRWCSRWRSIGFIWQLVYSPEHGLINNVLGRTEQGDLIDWLGDPNLNLWAVLVAAALAARRLHHDPLPGRAEERRPGAARGGGDRRRERVADVPPRGLPGAEADQHRRARRDGDRVAARVRHRLRHQQRRATAWSCCRCSSPTTSSARRAASATARRSP